MRYALLTFVLAGFVSQNAAAAQVTDVTTYRLTGTRIAIGQDVHIERNEEVTDAAVVVGGSLTVDGRVRDGIVVVGGDLRLTATADVRGDIVLVGGQLLRDEGARHTGSINYISFGEWSRRTFGWLPTFEFGDFGRWLSLAGTFARLSLLAVLMAFLLIVARAPVARTGRTAAAEPVRAALIGLAAEIFFVPFLIAASIGLAITIVGIPFVALLVPIALVIAVFALVLGFTSLACRLGEWLEDRLGWQPGNAFLATAIGFFLIIGPTLAARLIGVGPDALRPGAFALLMVGLAIEFLAWTIGLGAAILTGLGRWHTVPPPITTGTAPQAPSVAY
ncbi:MAG: polymer-forming cytoskeletal protein [Vicinamibacterales bacterium]|jgi:hypothetical protein